MSDYKFGYNLPSNFIYYRRENELPNCIISADSLDELRSKAEIYGLNMEAFKTSVANYCVGHAGGCIVTPKPWKHSLIGEANEKNSQYTEWKSYFHQYPDYGPLVTKNQDILNLSDPYASWKTQDIDIGDKVYLNPALGPIEMRVIDYYNDLDAFQVELKIGELSKPLKLDIKRSDLIPYFED